jgi:CO/xanthine dehydrogenase FAD-binding subunit
MGSVQTRNIGTLGGNIANASPAGDTIPPLYVLGSRIVMTSADGERAVSLTQFFQGPGKTVLRPCEMVKEILLRPMKADEVGFFRRLGLRGAHAISLASVAAWLKRGRSDNVFTDARIALGAVAPTVLRSKNSELFVKEAPLTKDRLSLIADKAASECMPISDVRATAAYRRAIVAALVYEGLSEILVEKQARW